MKSTKIKSAIILPLKENFSFENFGAVSIWVDDYISHTKKCNDIKYKNVCNEKDTTCFWNPGLNKNSDNRSDKFERGYCMNVDTISLEQVIDKYHNDEIAKLAKFRNLEAEFKKLNTDKEILDLLQKKA